MLKKRREHVNVEFSFSVACKPKEVEKKRRAIFTLLWHFTVEELFRNVNSVLIFILLSEDALSGEPEHLHSLSMTINLI